MSHQKHYTANDIERYHSGQLSAAEMNALEKAAMDDPFLADALEGYAFTVTQEKDINVLQQKLAIRIAKEDKRKGVFAIGNSWIRIAALFVFVAGGAWLLFRSSPETLQRKNDVAVSQEVKKNESLPTPLNNADSIGNVQGQESANDVVVLDNKPAEETVPVKDALAVNRARKPLPSSSSPSMAPVQNESAIQNSDASEVYMLRRQMDTLLKEESIASARNENQLKLSGTDSIKDLHIVLTPTGEEPETVVMNKSTAFRTRRQSAVVIDTLEPAEGWMRFDDYISSNLKTPDELKTKPYKGVVELAFEVNKDGEPVNITVVKSLCEKCDEEAIRLLKEGPKWKKNKKKGKVKISF